MQKPASTFKCRTAAFFMPAVFVLLVTLMNLSMAAAQPSDPNAADIPLSIVIEGGTVYTGELAPPVRMDVGIRDDRIVSLGDLVGAPAGQRIDARGLAVVPGFIDIHSHAVRSTAERSGLFLWPDAENYIRQGVTTAIGGPDGRSWYPISDLLERVERQPPGINFGTFVGHNRIRTEAMGRENRAPTAAELAAMEAMVEQAMLDGAYGLSSGLKYIPGAYSQTDEVIALARVAARYDGIYITHMREEGIGLLESVRETIAIGEATGIPVQVTHHKAMGKSMWGKSRESLALLDAAQARGVDTSSDQYPYAASSTGISVLLPAWAQAGDRSERLARFADAEQRPRVLAGIESNLVEDRGGNDLNRVAIASCDWNPAYNGKTLGELLTGREKALTMENAAALVLELEENGGCSAVYHAMADEDVERIMRHPRTMIASDGGIFMPGPNVPHPRNYGAFARVLALYVREKGTLDFTTAIHKMSRMPADRIGLAERGRIAPGAFADIAVLDPATVQDRATFDDPHQLSTGVSHVIVNGTLTLANGEMLGARAGRVLRSTD